MISKMKLLILRGTLKEVARKGLRLCKVKCAVLDIPLR